jgi:exonuclease III
MPTIIPSPYNYPALTRIGSLLSHQTRNQLLKIGSWNVQGKLNKEYQCDLLLKDTLKHKLDIIAIQETKAQDILYETRTHRILGFNHTNRHYGLAFVVKNDIHITNTERISDRIVAITIHLSDPHLTKPQSETHRPTTMTIINVYAPHSGLTVTDRQGTIQFYTQLQQTYTRYKNNTAMVLIVGDFNARVGTKASPQEYHLGAFTKKRSARNPNGYLLSEFALNNHFILANTCFNHRSSNISTFHGKFGNKIYYNQIDYLLCPQHLRPIIHDSRSTAGTKFVSDHKLLVTTFQPADFYIHNRNRLRTPTPNPTIQLDYRALAVDSELRDAYNTKIGLLLADLPPPPGLTPTDKWNQLHSTLVTAALATLPKQEQLLRYPDQSTDPLSQFYSSRIQHFNDKLYNHGANAPLHPNWPHLRTLKRHFICYLHKRRKYLHNNYLDSIATNLEKENRSSKYYNLAKKLHTDSTLQTQIVL